MHVLLINKIMNVAKCHKLKNEKYMESVYINKHPEMHYCIG